MVFVFKYGHDESVVFPRLLLIYSKKQDSGVFREFLGFFRRLQKWIIAGTWNPNASETQIHISSFQKSVSESPCHKSCFNEV